MSVENDTVHAQKKNDHLNFSAYNTLSAPHHLQYALFAHRYQGIDVNQPFHYLEYDCKQRSELFIHAALCPHAQFYGMDSDPLYIEQAQLRATSMQLANLHFVCRAAEDIQLDAQLPLFDFIVLGAAYSQKPVAERQQLMSFLQDQLKDNGMLYLHYNCGGVENQIQALRSQIQLLPKGIESSPEEIQELLYLLLKHQHEMEYMQDPAVQQRLSWYLRNPEQLKKQMLTEHWECLKSSTVIDELETVGMTFVGQAALKSMLLGQQLPADPLQYYQCLKTVAAQQNFLDLAFGISQRHDIYVKNPKRIEPNDFMQKIKNIRVRLPEKMMQMQQLKPLMKGNPKTIQMILDGLPKILANKSLTIENVCQSFAQGEAEAPQLGIYLVNLINLISLGHLQILHKHPESTEEGTQLSQLNRWILEESVAQQARTYLVCPATASAMSLNALESIVLDHYVKGNTCLDDLQQALFESIDRYPNILNYTQEEQDLNTEWDMNRLCSETLTSFLTRTLPSMQQLGLLI